MVVADLEAGIGTLTRMAPDTVDAVVVVVEPTAKSFEVGSRAATLAKEKALGALLVVANRLRGPRDLEAVEAAFAGVEIWPVPDDPAIDVAERAGVAPLDSSPNAPAVQALVSLGERMAHLAGA